MFQSASMHTPINAPKPLFQLAQVTQVTREIWIAEAISDVFDFVAGEGVLPKILTGYGLAPGVAFTSDVSGPWDRVGSHRVVHLADGSTAEEEVTHFDRPRYFAYRVTNPTFALKHFMSEARGQFWFTEENGGTRVTWTYSFSAKSLLARFPLTLFVKTQWNGFMRVCLDNVVRHFSS